MPYVTTPDGGLIEVADGTPPEVVARIRKQHMRAKIQERKASGGSAFDEYNSEVAKRANERQKSGIGEQGFIGKFTNAATFGLADRAVAGLTAVGNKVKGSTRSLGEEYNISRDVQKSMDADYSAENPWLSPVADISGAVANPVGASTGIGKLAAKIAPAFKASVDASRLGRTAAALGNSSIGLGARAGLNQGVITGALNGMDGEGTVLGNATNEGISQALAGGMFGGAIGAAGRVGKVFSDRMPENAPRVAYERIAGMLGRSVNRNTGKSYTPMSAANEIRATDAMGGDAMLMDLSPEMRNMAGYLSRKPQFSKANELVERAETRTDTAPDRFDAQIERVMAGNTAPDAYTARNAIQMKRKADAKRDYSPEVMDKPFVWNDELETFFTKDNELVRDAARRAERLVKAEDLDPKQHIGYSFDPITGTVKFERAPNMRTFDKMKKGFDQAIGEALNKGNRETARMYSLQLKKLKDGISQSNPEYMNVLARQRDAFEKLESLDLGESILKRISKDPRELLAELEARGNSPEVKLGIADALLHLRMKSQNPVQAMRRFMRHKDQRAVLQYAFGDAKTLAQFEKFMRREMRTSATDNMVSHSRQSATNIFKQVGDGDEMDFIGDISRSGAQGYAFGGSLGAVSRAVRSIDMFSSNLAPKAQEELARILMSKGDTLQSGISNAERHMARRDKLRKRRAQLAGKAGAGAVSGFAEE